MFNFFRRSGEKTKIMAKLNNALINHLGEEEKDKCYTEFYEFISNDDILGPILKRHNCSLDQMERMMIVLEANGYQIYKNQYIPTFAFSFAKPLEYYLTEFDKETPIYIIGYELKQMV